MRHRWKSLVSKLLVGTVVLQASLLNVVLGAPRALAAETPVVLNEVSPSGDWIELYATRDVDFAAEPWTVLTDSGQAVSLSGTLATGQFLVVSIPANALADEQGWVKLTHGTADEDRITWGNGFGAQLPGVVGLNTLARTVDGAGHWLSNVDASEGMSNVPEITAHPPIPSVVEVAEGTDNTTNVITAQTAGDVSVRASFAGTAELVALVVDRTGQATDAKDTLSVVLDAGLVEHINATNLADGQVLVRAYTEIGGIRSAWANANATKDTVAPSTPSDPTVRAGAKNGTNVINVYNAGDVRVSAGNSDAVTLDVTLDDGPDEVSATLPADGSAGLDARSLDDGAVELTVVAIDTYGNRSAAATTTLTKDTALPAAASNLTARNANGYVVLDWTASPSGDLGSYRIYGDRATGSIDWNSPLGEVMAGQTTFTTSVMPNGTNQFAVRAVSRVGNEETVGTMASVVVSGALEQATLSASNRTLDLIDPLRLLLRVAPTTVDTASVTVLNNSTVNPTGVQLPSGHSAVGKYFDLGTNNTTVFPLEIRVYYTHADLAAAGVADERQLEGIRFYSTANKRWELYRSTGANTADVQIGSLGFAGYLWAYADHLTPVVGSADITAPGQPTNLAAQSLDSRVKLSWDQMAHTAGYLVRYRPAGNDSSYTTLSISGGDVTSVTLPNLKNRTAYEFGVASVDWVGNQSGFATLEATPSAASTRADFVATNQGVTTSTQLAGAEDQVGNGLAGTAVGGSQDGTDATGGSLEGTGQDGQTPDGADDENGEVRGGTDESEAANTRTLVTILIIVIAAAAGFGGYYGYQWWMTKPESTVQDSVATPQEPAEPKKPKPTRTERSGRW